MVNTSEIKNEKLKNNEATVQVMKQPKTFAQQVEIIKEKGFIIDNDTECIRFLKQANYYRLSAYFLPFRKKDGTYFSNINFHRIQRIYEFDSRLRGVLFNYIEKVELYLRTQLAYYSGHVHGALGYMDGAIYNDRHNHEKFVKLLNVCIEENKSTSVVQHHKEKYGGNFPIWVIVEFFSMGMLSYFYADLQSGDQKYLAKELYGTSVACLKSWLRCITDLRNRRTLFKAVLLVISRITQNAKGIRNITKQKIVFTNTCIKIIISRQKRMAQQSLDRIKSYCRRI